MPPMSLPLAFIFHFNQHTNEMAALANLVCYRGLLQVLRAHPNLKCHLHLSGTLLRAWPWFDAEALDLVRAGVAAGQFELVGSTYAQNVPYASDDWDNAQQIALHRVVLQDLFGVTPTVFWNAERCWRQSLLPVITEGGYRVVPVENHILHSAGLTDPFPVTTQHGEQTLTAVYDDNHLRDRFNYAAWTGRHDLLRHYLQGYVNHPRAKDLLLVYAEDAEAMGLWGWHAGYLPHATWHRLDALLTELEQSGQFNFQHLSAVQPQVTLETLPDGAAQWMNAALQRPEAPYHEEGFTDWFDFNQRSTKNTYFRRLYGVFRTRLQALGSARADPGFPRPAAQPSDVFYRQAIENFCSHQYEFGCIGVGGRGYWGWENVRATFLFARVAEIAEEYTGPDAASRPPIWVEDVTGDGSDEQLFCDGRYLAVFSAYGARLLFWFDLTAARQLVGNQLAVPPAKFIQGSTKIPTAPPLPKAWVPATFELDLAPWAALQRQEPQPMQRHLPEWIWEHEPATLPMYGLPAVEGTDDLLLAQTGALVDYLTLDDVPTYEPDLIYDYRFEPGGLCYLLLLPDDETFILEKHVKQTANGLQVEYVFDNQGPRPRQARLTTRHELTPDYAAALGRGRAAYAFFEAEGVAGVRNTRTGHSVQLTASQPWQNATCQTNLLANEIGLSFELTVPAKTQAKLWLEITHKTES